MTEQQRRGSSRPSMGDVAAAAGVATVPAMGTTPAVGALAWNEAAQEVAQRVLVALALEGLGERAVIEREIVAGDGDRRAVGEALAARGH